MQSSRIAARQGVSFAIKAGLMFGLMRCVEIPPRRKNKGTGIDAAAVSTPGEIKYSKCSGNVKVMFRGMK